MKAQGIKERRERIAAMFEDGRLVKTFDIMLATQASERTVYRDIIALRMAGMPIASSPGVGYMLRRSRPPYTLMSEG